VHKSIYNKSHIDEYATVLLYIGYNKKVKRLFHATVHSLMFQATCRTLRIETLLWVWRIVCICCFTLWCFDTVFFVHTY